MARFVRLLLAALAALAFNVAPQATGTADAAGCVKIYRIYYDPSGSDTHSNAQYNREWIQLKSNCSANRSLDGYRIRDKANHWYTFGAYTLRPGAKVTVHTGTGADTAAHVYQDRSWYVWNNDGDKAWLYNSSGSVVKTCTYPGGGSGHKYC